MPPCRVDFANLCYGMPDGPATRERAGPCLLWPDAKRSHSATASTMRTPDSLTDVEDGECHRRLPTDHSGNPDSQIPKINSLPTRQILSHVSGHVCGCEILAILGPSGSGKTSLLNLISGRAEYDSGEILFDGLPMNSRTKRIMAYVQQDDVFFAKLTVRETLEFAASLRAPNAAERQSRSSRVDDVIARLRLDKCQHTVVGNQQFEKGISGGERKRLNIAYELLSEPDVFVLDEPTSGQDASNAMAIVRLLRELANGGKTIILTIHQPSSAMFDMFDKLMLLAGGEIAYFGEAARAESYFSSIGYPFPAKHNPCDFMLQLLIDDIPVRALPETERTFTPCTYVGVNDLTKLWSETSKAASHDASVDAVGPNLRNHHRAGHLESHVATTTSSRGGIARALTKRAFEIAGKPDPSGLPNKFETTWTSQVRVLAVRAFRQRRGRFLDPVVIVQFFMVTAVCSLFWFRMNDSESHLNDRIGVLFFYPAFWGFMSSGTAVFAFPPEKEVLSKDRASGSYRLSAYYFAKCLMEIPVDIIYPVLFSVVVYWVNNLNPRFDRFVIFTIVFSLTTLVAQGFGLLFSAALLNAQYANTLALVWNLVSMLMAGYYVHTQNIPSFIRPFVYLSYIRYCFTALVRNEVLGRTYSCVNSQEGGVHTVFSLNGKVCPRVSAQAVLIGAQLENSPSVWVSIVVLIGWCVIYRILGYLALKYLHRPRKFRNRRARDSR
jgi:ABC-type multidrug transport system ATPase subunit